MSAILSIAALLGAFLFGVAVGSCALGAAMMASRNREIEDNERAFLANENEWGVQ